MAVDKLVDSTQLDADLTSVANAIRTKGGTSAQMAFPAGFVSAVQAIPTGTTPTGTKQISITQNGTTTEDVTNYASAEITVNVQGGGGGNLTLIATTGFTVASDVPAGSASQNYLCTDNLYQTILDDLDTLTNTYQNMYLPIILYEGADTGGFVCGFEPVQFTAQTGYIGVKYQSGYHRYFKADGIGFGETNGSGLAFGYAASNQTDFKVEPSGTYVTIKTYGAVPLKAGNYSVSLFRINAPNLGGGL